MRIWRGCGRQQHQQARGERDRLDRERLACRRHDVYCGHCGAVHNGVQQRDNRGHRDEQRGHDQGHDGRDGCPGRTTRATDAEGGRDPAGGPVRGSGHRDGEHHVQRCRRRARGQLTQVRDERNGRRRDDGRRYRAVSRRIGRFRARGEISAWDGVTGPPHAALLSLCGFTFRAHEGRPGRR